MQQYKLDDVAQSLLNTIPDPFLIVSEDGFYLEFFGGTDRNLYDEGFSMKGRTVFEVLPKAFAISFLEEIKHTLEINKLNSFEYQLETDKVDLPQNGPGGVQWFEARMFPIPKPFYGKRAVSVMLINITERKQMQQRLQELSYLDPLTSLFNRRYFLEHISVEIRNNLKKGNPIAILLCDIDSFKQINDTYGHLAGDQVLVGFANLLKQSLGQASAIVRSGGDEFMVVLNGLSDEQLLSEAEELKRKAEFTPIQYNERDITYRISIGLAKLDRENIDIRTCIEKADQALYLAKAKGRNRIEVFGDLLAAQINK